MLGFIYTDGDSAKKTIGTASKEKQAPNSSNKLKGGDMPMRQRKWFIPIVVASVLLIGGLVGGAIVAADDSSDNIENQNQATDSNQALLDRACVIYEENTGVAINSEQLKDALKQARSEIQNEALESRLQNLVDEGLITQEEADNYLEWWQSRPDVGFPLPGLGRPGSGGGMMRGGCFQPWDTPDITADPSSEVSGL